MNATRRTKSGASRRRLRRTSRRPFRSIASATGDEQLWPALLGVVLLAAIWISTAFVQVPLHRALEREFDARAAQTLVRTNWFRPAAWTARGVIAIALLAN